MEEEQQIAIGSKRNPDPDWQATYEESHQDGAIVRNIESVFMSKTPYLQIKQNEESRLF